MIIENGTIAFKKVDKAIQSLDEDGYPILRDDEWSEDIPCQFIPNRQNNIGVSNGEAFTIAQYIVLMDLDYSAKLGMVARIDYLNDAKEVSVISSEILEAVNQIKILVA